MATRNGLEPSTSSVTGWRANRLHHRAKYGGNNRARTCDLLLVRQMLSQLSYAPELFICCAMHISDVVHYTHTRLFCQALFSIFSRFFSLPPRITPSGRFVVIFRFPKHLLWRSVYRPYPLVHAWQAPVADQNRNPGCPQSAKDHWVSQPHPNR